MHSMRYMATAYHVEESIYAECEAIFSLFATDLEVRVCLHIVSLLQCAHLDIEQENLMLIPMAYNLIYKKKMEKN